ncbi:MAG: acyl-CoA dehydrogenase family protein [Planctomycetaceae bacterium]|nr:acyl-CoA dehydrogenase family protein [Planctomycetaceae bacterium]
MDFALTQEQLDFQKMMKEFVEKNVAPYSAERDKKEDFAEHYKLMMEKMGPMGLLGLSFPKEYGGQGKTTVELALGMTEVCKWDVSLGAAWAVNMSLGTIPLLHYGTEEQKQKYLRPCVEGKKLAAFGLTEENAGSDAAMQETTAERDGESYFLNGKKVYITNASYAEVYIVMAMTDKSKGTKGISAFIVEKDTPGFTFGKQYEKCGIKASIQTELLFENCRVPKANLLGKEGEGFKIAMNAIDIGRIGVAAEALGCAKGAYELALQHAKKRVQFGKPITANQAISFMLADMAIKIELGELIMLKAAWCHSNGLPFSKYSSMAKKYCTDMAQEVSTNAVQIMGGMGYLQENNVERCYRDSKILQIYEGTNQVQSMVIAGHILKD